MDEPLFCEVCGHRSDVDPKHTIVCPHWWYDDDGAWM